MIEFQHCPHCDARLDPAAQFCDQCGARLSSAGQATQRLGSSSQFGQWLRLGDYLLCVHALIDGHVTDPAYRDAPAERTVCLDVSYRNETAAPLRYRLGQWMLYDVEGHAYEFEIRRYLYQGHDAQKLQDAHVPPGRLARGWVAFIVPEGAIVDYVQFRPNYMADKTLEIALR
jgi:hypothetical protein